MKPSRNIKAEDYRDDSSGALFTIINFGDEKKLEVVYQMQQK